MTTKAQTTHTPGPWTGKELPSGACGIFATKDGAMWAVARVFTGEEDARLIAAAPELKAMLEDAADHLDALHGLQGDSDTIRVKGHVNRYRALLARIDGNGQE